VLIEKKEIEASSSQDLAVLLDLLVQTLLGGWVVRVVLPGKVSIEINGGEGFTNSFSFP
jgi:hypothetical protein